MGKFEPDIGDRVRIDIPDTSDPDYEAYHGQHGTVADSITDDAGRETGDDRDDVIYRVEFEDGSTADFRWRDLRPPL